MPHLWFWHHVCVCVYINRCVCLFTLQTCSCLKRILNINIWLKADYVQNADEISNDLKAGWNGRSHSKSERIVVGREIGLSHMLYHCKNARPLTISTHHMERMKERERARDRENETHVLFGVDSAKLWAFSPINNRVK